MGPSAPKVNYILYSNLFADAVHREDPSVLEKAHVVITTYSTAASEYAASGLGAADETNMKGKSKKKKSAADSDDDDDDSSSESFGSSVKTRGSRKKAADALYHIKWWRVVLGK